MSAEGMENDGSRSATPVPSTERAVADTADAATDVEPEFKTGVTDDEYEAMQKILNAIYDYRTEDGFDPSSLFHKKVNKRNIPEYYDTIKEPIAMSTIKFKIHKREYTGFREFVRDFALIPHNAQVFNKPNSGAFQDALIIKEQLEKHLQALVESGFITQEIATLPDLGEIPTYEDVPLEEPAAEQEEEDDSEEEGEDDDDEEVDDDEQPKKKRGRPKGSKNKVVTEDDVAEGGKKARGRPPRLLTPMEARIQAILKGIRKPKNSRGQLMIKTFDRLPDKQAMPEYYVEIKNPIAYDLLKRKVKRKKYKSVEDFMADVNLMFNNAKTYNQDDSSIYKEANYLQVEAGRLYDEEKAKPDDSFAADNEGKTPMPNGILHSGELYKVGDWVHIQNPNDMTKPIPAQIYRTFKNASGQDMVNVCWYYRPEQTVHRFDKHFLPNEVVKTGRYRDHHIEELEGKCFIMFLTRYFKGRPRGTPQGAEVYVCEARYNEQQHAFNKIKTWASCLPDEVRDKDYEMDLFDHPRKMKKLPSPIAYLLKDEQKETDELPKVTWGAEGAPPKIGAVHRRPRGDKDSPPPEPTPPPPPKLPTPPPRPAPMPASYQPSPALANRQQQRPPPTMSRTPSLAAAHSNSFSQPNTSPALPRTTSTQPGYPPHTPQSTAPRPMAPAPSYQQMSSIPPNPASFARTNTAANYRDPPPIEVYVLPDHANLSIPSEIREQYQRDDYGRMLFFTAPPAPVASESASDGRKPRSHSIRYLAEKSRRKALLEKKRKERGEEDEEAARHAKIAKVEGEVKFAHEFESLKRRALSVLERQMSESVAADLGDGELEYLSAAQKNAQEQEALVQANARRRAERKRVPLSNQFYADDWDNRLS